MPCIRKSKKDTRDDSFTTTQITFLILCISVPKYIITSSLPQLISYNESYEQVNSFCNARKIGSKTLKLCNFSSAVDRRQTTQMTSPIHFLPSIQKKDIHQKKKKGQKRVSHTLTRSCSSFVFFVRVCALSHPPFSASDFHIWVGVSCGPFCSLTSLTSMHA